jgi:adenylate cyclase
VGRIPPQDDGLGIHRPVAVERAAFLCDYGQVTDSLDPYRFRDKPYLRVRQAAERAGVDYETALRLHRAMGLPEVDDDAAEFDDRDVEALQVMNRIHEWGVPLDDLIDVARVYGQAFTRIADAETHIFRKRFIEPLMEQGRSVREIEDELAPMVEELLQQLASSTDYVHRRHLGMALKQLTAESSEQGTELLTVGFADLVDFSRIADHLGGTGLSEVIERFEQLAIKTCLEREVRMVKMIGDATMFVSPDSNKAVSAAMDIVEKVTADELLDEARAGLDRGEIVPVSGDYFGHPINVAARITAFARPGTTVVSEAVLNSLEPKPDVGKIGSHRLKGVGKVAMFKVRPPERQPAS